MAADRTESVGDLHPVSGLGWDDLIALTDEMAALVRAGVPLETGLAEMATELCGKQRNVANNVAAQLRAGKTLPQVLERSPETFPPIYTAVVEAGLRSGRLSSALRGWPIAHGGSRSCPAVANCNAVPSVHSVSGIWHVRVRCRLVSAARNANL